MPVGKFVVYAVAIFQPAGKEMIGVTVIGGFTTGGLLVGGLLFLEQANKVISKMVKENIFFIAISLSCLTEMSDEVYVLNNYQ